MQFQNWFLVGDGCNYRSNRVRHKYIVAGWWRYRLLSGVDDRLWYLFIIPVPFLLALLVLHHTVSEEKKFWTIGALLFGVMYGVYVIQNYVVQLVTVAPAWLQGTLSEISVLNQTPHSLFWDLDALGYIFQSFAFLIAYPVFEKHGLENLLRLFFMANGVNAPLIAIIYFYPTFSLWLPIMLAISWAILVPGSMLLLALFFRKRGSLIESLR